MDGHLFKSYQLITHFQLLQLTLQIHYYKFHQATIPFFTLILLNLKKQKKVMKVLLSALVISASLRNRILIVMMLFNLEIYILKFPILLLLMLGVVLRKSFGSATLHTFTLPNLTHH